MVELKNLLIIEIIARVIRKILWCIMRQENLQEEIEKNIFEKLNLCFGTDEISKNYLMNEFIEEIKHRFILSTTMQQFSASEQYLKKMVQIIMENNEKKNFLLQRIQILSGIEIKFQEDKKMNNNFYFTSTNCKINFLITSKIINYEQYIKIFEDFHDAIYFYQNELKARIELLGENNIQVATIRDHLAFLYNSQGKKYFNLTEEQVKF